MEEGDGAFLLLVGQHLTEGDARGVVDTDMDELPADTPAVRLAVTVAGNAVAAPVESAQLLAIAVDQFAGMGAFVAAHRLGRIAVAHAHESRLAAPPAHGGWREPARW